MIWITQWLCPQRHCSIALAWDDIETNSREIEKRGEDIYRSGAINRYCGICSGELHVEHGRTKYRTLSEAMPDLLVIQEANLRARDILSRKN